MKAYRKTIVVFGCTGTVGKVVFERLLKEDCYVRGVLRHPKRTLPVPLNASNKHSYVSADLDHPKALEAACFQADTVFLLTATHPNQIQQEINIIKAAKKMGVNKVVKLSAPSTGTIESVEVAKWHREIEAYLESSGLDFCCLRSYAFMQNWERNTFTIQRFGKIFGAMKDATRNYIDVRDVAEIAVKQLLQNEGAAEKYLTLSGPEAISHSEMAERLSNVTNTTIEYVDIPPSELRTMLQQRAKLPKWLANHIVELDELAVKIPEPTTDSVEKLLLKKPRVMDAYLLESKHCFQKKRFGVFS